MLLLETTIVLWQAAYKHYMCTSHFIREKIRKICLQGSGFNEISCYCLIKEILKGSYLFFLFIYVCSCLAGSLLACFLLRLQQFSTIAFVLSMHSQYNEKGKQFSVIRNIILILWKGVWNPWNSWTRLDPWLEFFGFPDSLAKSGDTF
jgi:hypothetical protein